MFPELPSRFPLVTYFIRSSNSFGHLMRRVDSLERLWCWEGLGAGGEGDDRGGDGWMASLTRWTWVWVNSGSWWWWTGRPGVLPFMGSQRVEGHWATELNWYCFFPRFHIRVLIHGICFSLSDLLHSVWQSLGSSIFLQMTQFRYILWLINILLYMWITSSLSIPLLMNI